MITQSLTLSLPQPIFQYLQEVASATHQSLEQVVLQSVEGNLPPPVDNAPQEMQAELLTLQTLSIAQLKMISASQITPSQQTRHLELLEKNQESNLTSQEQQELTHLRLEADRLMLRKAYAWAVLRWRGQSTPTLDELPLN